MERKIQVYEITESDPRWGWFGSGTETKLQFAYRTKPISYHSEGSERVRRSSCGTIKLFTFIALYHISVRFWHQAIVEHFDFQVGTVHALLAWYGCPFAGIPIFRREVTGGVT